MPALAVRVVNDFFGRLEFDPELDEPGPVDHELEKKSSTTTTTTKPTMADLLVGIVSEAVLFHTAETVTYATIAVEQHVETHKIGGSRFRLWLARQFWEKHGRAPSADALRQAITVLEGQALYEGDEQDVHVRVADDGDHGLYLDLADATWRAVHVTAHGWQTVERPPIRFRRAPGMLPLPEPTPGGSLADLAEFVNVDGGRDGTDFVLLVGWLVGALRALGPFLVMMLLGEQGSGKSLIARILRALVDPNQAALRAEPRDPRDVAIAANNARVIALDNLSGMRDWLSDCLCRLATGGGFATRALFTDDEERIFDAQRPIILNGISDVGTRGDLLDRGIILNIPRIKEYRTEDEIWERFEQARPTLLGALLDAVSMALRQERGIQLERSVRMADAARWVVAAEPVLPWEGSRFLDAYVANRADSNTLALEASPVGGAIVKMNRAFTGTASELKVELESTVISAKEALSRDWPKAANVLSSKLKRAAPNLRALGWVVESQADGKRTIVLAPPETAKDRQYRQDRQADPEVFEFAKEMAGARTDDVSGPSSASSGSSVDRQDATPRDHDGTDGTDDADGSSQSLEMRARGGHLPPGHPDEDYQGSFDLDPPAEDPGDDESEDPALSELF